MRGPESGIPETLDLQDERACAYGRSIVFLRGAYPNAALMTYDDEVHRGAEQLNLCKLVFGTGSPPELLTYESCDESTACDNIRGGLLSRARCGGAEVTVAIYPLILPHEKKTRGGAVVHIRSSRPGIFVRFGCGNIAFMHFSPNVNMRGTQIDCEHGAAEIAGGAVRITREERGIITYVRGSGFKFTVKPGSGGGSFAEGYCPAEEAYLVLGFSRDEADADAIARADGKTEIERIEAYYAEKLSNLYVRTPDGEIDAAFEAAWLNLEYAWLYPYGWIESIQHWPTMWHMEHTAAEEWAGNADRTRRTLLTQLEHIFDSGAIPDMCTNDTGRRDWGGNNQFFFREIMHYLEMTDDREFAELAEPYMRRILAQTFREYDAGNTGVLSWHSQIGNQEDFESTPGSGAAPGTEGVRMLRIMSEYLKYLGKTEESAEYAQLSVFAWQQLRKKLWKNDLGRFSWFKDGLGAERLDTTYHGICYPVIYGYTDSLDNASALDHLRHRMSGPEGEVYQSNHFGDHGYWGVPTWGMQAGSDMQPFAAAAYAAQGMNREAIEPLKFVAKRVCGEFQRGAFPETANEKRLAYFSPSAAVFAQAVIESLFGVKRDMIARTLTLSPCFPADWREAELRLPSLSYKYSFSDNTVRLRVFSADGCRKQLLLRTPPLSSAKVNCNGKPVPCAVAYKCGFCELSAELTEEAEADVVIELTPLTFSVKFDGTAAEGETVNIDLAGCELLGVTDRAGIFADTASMRLRRDILEPYKKYGTLGLVNFSRRTFALRLRAGETDFEYPVSITVTPAFEVRASYDSMLHVRFRNFTKRAVNGNAALFTCGSTVKFPVNCPSETAVNIDVPADIPALHGKNRAVFVLDGYAEETELISATPFRGTPLSIDPFGAREYTAWREYGLFPHHGCAVMGPDEYLKNVPATVQAGGIDFPLCGKFVPVSAAKHIDANIRIGRPARKLYVLFSAFADDHEVFCEAFSAVIECEKQEAYTKPTFVRPLTVAGELDFGFSNAVLAGFSTYVPGTERNASLPPSAGGDYAGTLCPDYPQRALWCVNEAAEAGGAVFNLLEFDLGKTRQVETLVIRALAQDGAGGIFAVMLE
ncbi:MAG: hypothetical protein J6V14_03635 [Clostridia bacterium]|nr:hypothetical protein [Clostridia bacterium]